jgi:hypothetical protein
MKSQRAPFQSLAPEIADDKLEALAREKGVGTLISPASREQGTSSEPPAPVAADARPGATPRSRMKTVNLELPDYVWTELKIRAAHRQTSVRHVVMSALVNDGFTIEAADMIEDGRRIRGREAAR